MNKRTDLVLVTFLEDQKQGESFVRSRHNGWPLHVTIFPWFGVADPDEFGVKLAELAKTHQSFHVTVGQTKMFGPEANIPVNVMQDQAALKQLHTELAELILPNGELFESRWIGDNYNAHVTQHEGESGVRLGDIIAIDHLYLVRMLDDDHCMFLKKYPLAGSAN